jgi:hypothetical protein
MARDRQRLSSGELDQPTLIASELIELSARTDALAAERMLLEAQAALETAVQSPLTAPFFDAAAATRIISPEADNGSSR